MSLDDFPDIQLANAYHTVSTAWQHAWEVPPRLEISQWADAYRKIARGSGAEPGQWRTDRHPPLREIMNCLSDHTPVQQVSFMKSGQIGATEIGINWVCYVIDRGIDSMIVTQPVKDLARTWTVAKFDPGVLDMPPLLNKLTTNNTFEKQYPGGTLFVKWANSSSQLRQITACYAFLDEIDEYPRNLNNQGTADQQIAARIMSHGERGKIYRACTPTVAGGSAIETNFLDGDQRHYHIHCPHCGGEQVLDLEHLQPDGTFACAVNGCIIQEHHKNTILKERGTGGTAFWHPHNPSAPPDHRSYHLWAAYAPLGLGLSWKQIADKWAEAKRDPSKLPGFTNLILGLPFQGERDVRAAHEVATLAEPGVYRGLVPLGGLVLAAGVDLAHDRAEIHLIATGRGQRRYIVDYAVIDLDPTVLDSYTDLDTYLRGTWKTACGIDMPISAVAIDGGNWTETVAQFIKQHVGWSGQSRILETPQGFLKQTLYLVRGRAEIKSDRAVYRPSKTTVDERGKTLARDVGVWGVGTSVLKHMIYGWLGAALAAKDNAAQTGTAEDISARMLRFPGGRGDDIPDPLHPDPGALPEHYFAGLTAEYFDKDAGRWIKPRGVRNEPLDTAVYALWATLAPALKVDVMRESQWEALEAIYQPTNGSLFDPPAAPPTDPAPRPLRSVTANPAPP
ncbi:phage terminase large subunit family protein, partial [Xylella fastidiosa]|uniref:phage terminase large subunit family protein n=1 Tax=Xylella fastidiosa TaxID=2371 RepID=UPI00111F1A77